MLTESYIKIEKTLKDVGFNSVVECIRYHGKHLGDREAVVFASFYGNREVVTWNDLLNKSTAVAKSLVNLGVKPGDFVGIKLRSCPVWLYLAFGTMMAGACTGSISFRFRDGSDLVATMEKMEKCNVLVMDPGERGQNWATIKSLLDEYSPDGAVRSRKLPTLKYLFGYEKDGENYMKGVKNVNDLIAETHEDVTLPEIRPTDNAVTFQTSGSTGTPKLVVHTHSNLLYVCQLVSEDTKFYLDSTCVNFNDRPFTWLGGFPWSVISGQKRVTISAFETVPEDRVPGIIKIIVEEKCTTMSALQPVIHELVDRKDEIPADWPMEMLISGGQPLTNSLQEAIGIVAPSMCNGYGGTEFFGVASGVISNKSDFKEYWCGKVSANGNMEVKLVDENEQIVPVNTRGEIYVRSAGVFSGYLNDPEKTAAVKTPDGWYKTDDIGMLTEDGELYVFGRKSNMIISGNVNIAPDMLERTLEQHPGVYKAIVVPIPDKVLYQVPCACVVREKGNDVSEEQLRAFWDDTINDKSGLYTVPPKYYLFFDKFPETMSGKISRPAVIEKALGLIEVNT